MSISLKYNKENLESLIRSQLAWCWSKEKLLKPLRRNSRPDFSHMLEKTNALRCNKSSKIGDSYIKILVYGMG